MRILLLTILLSGIATLSFSQTFNYGIKGGVNFSDQLYSNPGNPGSKALTGFNAGIIGDIGFGDFSIQPGVFYATKGIKNPDLFLSSMGDIIATRFNTTKVSYIEVPIDAIYKVNITNGFNVHFGAGPYLAYGVSQSITIAALDGTTSTFNGATFDFKKTDFGANLIAGFTLLNKILIDASYDYGISNISLDQYKTRNSTLSLSVGYLFK